MFLGILKRKKGVKIQFAPVNNRGEVEIDEIKKLINSKTKIIFDHISNVTGAIYRDKKKLLI